MNVMSATCASKGHPYWWMARLWRRFSCTEGGCKDWSSGEPIGADESAMESVRLTMTDRPLAFDCSQDATLPRGASFGPQRRGVYLLKDRRRRLSGSTSRYHAAFLALYWRRWGDHHLPHPPARTDTGALPASASICECPAPILPEVLP